jgi:hypothetical protein
MSISESRGLEPYGITSAAGQHFSWNIIECTHTK